ncbi:MAG: aldo/keto reductase [Christensenellales bacterium]|jgi:predicted aldo/keto reductase-like oxidoreductase
MNYRTLGRSGLKVSEVGLGCEHLQGLPYEQVKSVIDAALAGGVNVMDVFMSEPEVRTNIGKALSGRREQVVLQGHIGAAWLNGQYKRTRDLAHCKTFFEDFLTRLQTDYVDIGMIHFVDSEEDYKSVFESDVIEYAKQLKAEGKIKALGMSSHNPSIAERAVRTGLIDVLMFSINPVYDLMPENVVIDELTNMDSYARREWNGIHPDREQLYKTCEAMGTGITVMKSLAAGNLLKAETSPFGVALTPVQCIHYVLTRPAVASAMVGCKTAEEMQTALSYETASPEERDYSEILSHTPKYSLKGKCMYCNHCLPCPKKIDVAQVNKYLDLTEVEGEATATVKEHYAALSAHASDCIACGSCEKNCPFSVQIIERMKKAKEVFGL